jgi:hypothetical protein
MDGFPVKVEFREARREKNQCETRNFMSDLPSEGDLVDLYTEVSSEKVHRQWHCTSGCGSRGLCATPPRQDERKGVPLRAPVSSGDWDLECENSRCENYGRPHFPHRSARMPAVSLDPGDNPSLRQVASLGGRGFQKQTRWTTAQETDLVDMKLDGSQVVIEGRIRYPTPHGGGWSQWS